MFRIRNIEQKIFVHWTIVWNRQDWCWKIERRWFNVRWTVEKIYTWKCDSDVAFDFVSTVRPFTFFFEINMKRNIWLRIFWIWISILMIPVICAIIENNKIHLWDTIYSDWWCPWWIVVWMSDEKIITSDLSWNIQCEYYLSAIDYDLKKKNLKSRQTATWYEYLIDRL